jgi:hypothetical protein
MASRARLSIPPPPPREEWPYHKPAWSSVSTLFIREGDRRMEAETFLSRGYGIRVAIKSQTGWVAFSTRARVWQPSRLKGIQLGAGVGTAFLSATQVFNCHPRPRKWLALERTNEAAQRFVRQGQILVTRSGAVGRPTLTFSPHLGVVISDDLLRVDVINKADHGWIYAYLRTPTARAMMSSVKYGHVIKHLEPSHLDVLPLPDVSEKCRQRFNSAAAEIVELRGRAYAATIAAEKLFSAALGTFQTVITGENGFVVSSMANCFAGARRLDATRHNPVAGAIVAHIAARGSAVRSLFDCGYRVWVPGRYKRVPAVDGIVFVDSGDLFDINPDLLKRYADCGFGDEFHGRVEPGWLLLASSGQTYGIVGNAVLSTDFYTGKVIANHVIRIAPRVEKPAPAGYVLTALTHPIFGRPLVKSYAFGSSVPEIAPEDIERFPIVRLPPNEEVAIARLAEESADLRGKADILENKLTEEAESILERFVAGEKSDLKN